MYHLGRRVREKLAGSDDPRDRPVLDLNWNYTTEVENGVEEPSAESVLCEINGYDSEGNPLDDYLVHDQATSWGMDRCS
jgi:formate dehydrogenase major subunit